MWGWEGRGECLLQLNHIKSSRSIKSLFTANEVDVCVGVDAVDGREKTVCLLECSSENAWT